MNVQVAKTEATAQRILLSVQLWRKCTITILNHFYCPRLSSVPGRKKYIYKRVYLWNMPAQPYQGSNGRSWLRQTSSRVSEVQKESRMYRKIALVQLQVWENRWVSEPRALCWPVSPTPFSFSSTEVKICRTAVKLELLNRYLLLEEPILNLLKGPPCHETSFNHTRIPETQNGTY